VRDEVGKTKPTVYRLPQEPYIYGRSLDRDPEGAKEVSMTWKFHDSSPEIPPQKNFLKLNELGVVHKAVRPKDVKEFRKGHDARMPVRRG
jgi:hypothetical protein